MTAASTTATAHPNIALLKYWGKQDGAANLPAAPSLSITLDTLTTTTTVADAPTDSVSLNGGSAGTRRIALALADWRRDHAIGPLAVSSRNNFPTAAGLASSASGFAALATAVDAHCGLELTVSARAALARRGSASAARSMHGGFVGLSGPDWQGTPLLAAGAWPLKVVIAVTSTDAKPVSSRHGMAISRASSPYYDAWIASTESTFPLMRTAVQKRDFVRLAALAEASCLRMHALMMSGDPALIYWNATTLSCIHAVRALRDAGHSLFFTVDAGPQVKVICEQRHAEPIRRTLAAQAGVRQTMIVGIGAGAAVVSA